MEEVAETSPKPEGQGAASAAPSHVPQSDICDGKIDCDNGEDEVGCCSADGKDSDWFATGNRDCCTNTAPCDVGEGDCDEDIDCAGSLVCGDDNCAWSGNQTGSNQDDCCVDPQALFTTSTTSTTTMVTTLTTTTTTTSTTITTTTTTTGCIIKENIWYNGTILGVGTNGNDQSQNDSESCRLFCRANYPTATHFGWVRPSSAWIEGRNSCWCKNSISGEEIQQDAIAGEVNCEGNDL